MDEWETYYNRKLHKDVQIYRSDVLNGVAKFDNGTYQLLVKDSDDATICSALALAAIDSVDNHETNVFRFLHL